ncbi:MAG: hypothetical protein WCT53_04490 [Candidatus Gracilibacteria bacterium]|jgi:hypothetical protein
MKKNIRKNILVAAMFTGLLAMVLIIGNKIGLASIVINTNTSSLEAQKNLSKAQENLQASFDRLSSGYRINSASDDAAGLALSENMKAQMDKLKTSMRDTSEGVSILQTSEEYLIKVSDILVKTNNLVNKGLDDKSKQVTDLVKGLDGISLKINSASVSLPRIKLINKPVSEIIKDAREVLTNKKLTKKQRLAKINADLPKIEKCRKDIVLYATSIEKASQSTVSSAEEAWNLYSRWKR